MICKIDDLIKEVEGKLYVSNGQGIYIVGELISPDKTVEPGLDYLPKRPKKWTIWAIVVLIFTYHEEIIVYMKLIKDFCDAFVVN